MVGEYSSVRVRVVGGGESSACNICAKRGEGERGTEKENKKTHPHAMLIQELPHALCAQLHNDTKLSVGCISADAVGCHDVLVGVRAERLEAVHVLKDKKKWGTQWETSHTQTQTHGAPCIVDETRRSYAVMKSRAGARPRLRGG